MKRILHRLLHGKAELVMANQFCTGYKCRCGAYLWTGPNLRAFATLALPRLEAWRDAFAPTADGREDES